MGRKRQQARCSCSSSDCPRKRKRANPAYPYSEDHGNVVMQKLLAEGIGSDLTIVPGTGDPVKCHASILRASSAVFEAMLTTDMKESSDGKINIPEMCEEGVRAFLAYIYYLDLGKAGTTSAIAFEVLQAGHKYNVISNLEKKMKQIFLDQSTPWFELEVAVQLFMYARTVYTRYDELTLKAVAIIKREMEEVAKLDVYKEIFSTNPEAAMDLCSLLAFVD